MCEITEKDVFINIMAVKVCAQAGIRNSPEHKNRGCLQIWNRTAKEKENLESSHRFLHNYQSCTEKIAFCNRLNGKSQIECVLV